MTFDEFMVISHEDAQENLLDGVMYVASPVGRGHWELSAWLTELLGVYVRERELGHVMFERVAFRLSDTWAPVPDVAFVCTERMGIIRSGYVDGVPDFVVEIASPESEARDYEIKREGYEKFGVKEYWIIDPDEQVATFLVLGESRYEEAKLDRGMVSSRAIPGFRVAVNWLWQKPLPRTLPILQTLLGN